jgi:hypothetical protein
MGGDSLRSEIEDALSRGYGPRIVVLLWPALGVPDSRQLALILSVLFCLDLNGEL